MTADGTPPGRMSDPEKMSEALAEFSERGQRIVQAFCERQAEDGGFQLPDPVVIGKAFVELGNQMLADPARLAEAQTEFWRQTLTLWETAAKRWSGEDVDPAAEPAADDRRFKDKAWNEEAVFDVIKQSYLLSAQWLQSTVGRVDGLDPKTAEKVNFYTRQFVDALAPSNFALTNPKVFKETLDTGGENLLRGLDHLLQDLEAGKGKLRISMTDADAFSLGENIATTPGSVVFQNDLMQLLQYEPSTEKVFKRPLLVVPPWINKYYILDLQPKNSFIKWAVDQGHTVFVVSWVNPDADLAHKRFDDYMLEGPMAAFDAIERATGEKSVNVIGYCIGGTLMAATFAYMAERGDERVKSATFFTTMVDFEEPGELGVFIDEEQLDLLEQHMDRKGYLDGAHMSHVFNLLRDNDLIWSFVGNNYLMAREPLAFDLLYWNSDSTRMPAMMHAMYLRKFYLENKLVEPGGVELDGVAIDLRRIEAPVYMASTREDHIAPWKSTYRATQLYAGAVRFVLSASGHIAGVVNPPAANKYCYWTNPECPADPEQWLAAAKPHDGSWWTDWQTWIEKQAGAKVAKRVPGDGGLDVIEPAPGTYVKVRLNS